MKIRIRQYEFDIAEPFVKGSVLSPGEAQALNGLRAENIRNNMSKPVLLAVSMLLPGELLDPATLSELQDKIARYDSGYQFPLRFESSKKRGAIELEARALAEAEVETQLRRAGVEVSEEEKEKLVVEMELTPAIQGEARKRVQARQQVAKETLESLL